jgi:hypothetical protein
VAFIDADAMADRDWLYHLAETIMRRKVVGAGGQNFAPGRTSPIAAAIAAAPGQPQEVRLGDQDLAQLCGCCMAVDKVGLGASQLFDSMFTTAGDDVDFSWRLRDAGITLAYAPGATVMHERRTSIRAYLQQQRGYGHAEGLLFRKDPSRRERVYDESGWFGRWFSSGPRIYYGEYGRGLFQTIYSRAGVPLAAQLPLSFPWVAIAIVLAVAGIFNQTLGILGVAALLLTFGSAIAGALESAKEVPGLASSAILTGLWVMGPLLRSWERVLVKWSFAPDNSGKAVPTTKVWRGTIPLARQKPRCEPGAQLPQNGLDEMIDVLHLVLVRRGLAVAKGTSYDSFDLQIIIAPFIRVAILFLSGANALSLRWRTSAATSRIAAPLTGLLLILLAGGFSLAGALVICALAAAGLAALALWRAWRVPAVLGAAAAELTVRSGIESEAGRQRPLPAASAGEAAS